MMTHFIVWKHPGGRRTLVERDMTRWNFFYGFTHFIKRLP